MRREGPVGLGGLGVANERRSPVITSDHFKLKININGDSADEFPTDLSTCLERPRSFRFPPARLD